MTDRKRIAWELERTAMGDGYYADALCAAKELPEATPCVRALLDRWITGKQDGLSDRTGLCAFALQIHSLDLAHEIKALRADVAEWKARADDLAAALNNCIKLAYNCNRDELPSAIITTASKAIAKYECVVAEIERDEAMLRQALQALEKARDALYEGHPVRMNTQKAITALRERLGEGE